MSEFALSVIVMTAVVGGLVLAARVVAAWEKLTAARAELCREQTRLAEWERKREQVRDFTSPEAGS